MPYMVISSLVYRSGQEVGYSPLLDILVPGPIGNLLGITFPLDLGGSSRGSKNWICKSRKKKSCSRKKPRLKKIGFVNQKGKKSCPIK